MLHLERIDLQKTSHCTALTTLLNAYAQDPMGGGEPLHPKILEALPQQLAKRSDYLGILAFNRAHAIGLLNAFEGFSTFNAEPLLNIHDIYVAPVARGNRVAHHMLAAVEKISRQRGYCKMTLEVLRGNAVAKRVYSACGFHTYTLDASTGAAEFWQKELKASAQRADHSSGECY